MLFFAFILLELIVIGLQQRKNLVRVNGMFSNIAAGITQQITGRLILRGFELYIYIWVYDNFCVYALPWNSQWTWWVCFLLVDLGYYWFHRAAHEVNIMWAAHGVHHSSEYYNLSTALRQSSLQAYTSWIFYLPAALFVPPSLFAAHRQFNTLYQFWIHTQVIKTLGPLEWVMNTPSHHRVHHGRNRYCIDKNYAGTLIIWDRMFGTFAAESEEVVYGLTHPLTTWDPVWTQLHHVVHIANMVWKTPGLANKVSHLGLP